MSQRVRLTWNRNHDIETEFYRVYRSEKPDINDKNRSEHLVMRVEHPIDVQPIKVENETLVRYSSRTYLIDHQNILLELGDNRFPFILEVNGQEVVNFVLDTVDGRILFDDPLEADAEVIAKEYTFDGVQVWDYAIDETDKTYYGPEALDLSAPFAPTNVRLEPDYEKNRVIVRFHSSSPRGRVFYYRIDAAKHSQHHSGLSEWRTGVLEEPLADRPYIIERSLNGVKWQEIAKVKENVFYEYMIDRDAPNPLRNIISSVYIYYQSSRAQVTLSWDAPADTVFSESPIYRIRAVNKVGAVSEPSNAVGPIPFQVGLKEIVIKRKVNDGTLPTFEGNESELVAIIPADQVAYSDEVVDNHEYIYGLWLVDYAGNRSVIAYHKVLVADATAPPATTIVSIDELQLVNG